MTEEEKKAIEIVKKFNEENRYRDCGIINNAIDTLINLVVKQQKEIEELTQITKTYNAFPCNKKNQIIIADKEYFDRGLFVKRYISKDKIKQKLHQCEEVYKKEMKPYQREYGLDVTYLSKKEKKELINKRNCLHTQMKTYEMLLEE